MRPWLAAAVVATLSVVACGSPGATGVPPTVPPSASSSASPSASPIVLPTRALVAWDGFPADQVPRPIVLMGSIYSPSGFSSLQAKDATFCRKFKAGATLPKGVPSGAYASWAGGANAVYPAISAAAAFAAMAASTPEMSAVFCALVVGGAHFGAFDFLTDRGTAHIYSWLFTAKGVNDYLGYPGLAPSPRRKGGPIKRLLNARATVATDERTLAFSFYGAQAGSGPCDADYKGLVAESKSAVAVALQEIPNTTPGPPSAAPGSPSAASPSPPACIPIVVLRSVTVTLAGPLGGRVVVDASGAPVSVCPAALTRSC